MAARERRVRRLEKKFLRRLDEVIYGTQIRKVEHLRHGYDNLAAGDQERIDGLEAERLTLLRRISNKPRLGVVAFASASSSKSA